jgi:hypothetical protein
LELPGRVQELPDYSLSYDELPKVTDRWRDDKLEPGQNWFWSAELENKIIPFLACWLLVNKL